MKLIVTMELVDEQDNHLYVHDTVINDVDQERMGAVAKINYMTSHMLKAIKQRSKQDE